MGLHALDTRAEDVGVIFYIGRGAHLQPGTGGIDGGATTDVNVVSDFEGALPTQDWCVSGS